MLVLTSFHPSYGLRYVVLACLFAIVNFSAAQVKKGPVPEFVEPLPEFTSILTLNDASDGWVYSIHDVQISIAAKTRYYHYKRKIFTEAGVENASEISLNYDPTFEKIVFHSIQLNRNGEKIDKLDLKKIKEIQQESNKESHMYDGSLTAFLVLEDVRVNDEIEYSYSLIGSNPIYENKFAITAYTGFYDKSDQYMLRVVCPETTALSYKLHNSVPEPEVVKEGKNKIVRLYVEHLPAHMVDSDLPSWYEPYPSIDFSEFKTWKEVKLILQDHYRVSEAKGESLKNLVDSIVAKNPSKEKQIVAALQFVQNEIRYVGMESGISGYKPEQPEKVASQRFGDCKGKSLLFCTLLKSLGIEAYPALVHTEQKQELAEQLPSPGLFNHCVVQVKMEGKSYWYDPTSTYQRGSFDKYYFPNYKIALVFDSTDGLTSIPVQGISKSDVVEDYYLYKVGGIAKLKVVSRYYGAEADNQRYYFATTNIKQIEKNYANFYAGLYTDVEMTDPITFSDEADSNVFIVKEAYKISNFWNAPDTSNPARLETTQYAKILRDKLVSPNSKIRTMPLAITHPMDITQVIRYHLPEPWSMQDNAGKIDLPGMKFNYSQTYVGDVITLEYHLHSTRDFIDAKETPLLVKKIDEVIDQLGFSLTHNSTPEAPSAVNTITVLIAVIVLLVSAQVLQWMYRFNPPSPLESEKEIGGWLILPLIGLILSAIATMVTLFNSTYFDEATWKQITDKTSIDYHPFWATFFVSELVYNICFILFSGMLIFLFISKRSSVPKLMVWFYTMSLAFILLEYIGMYITHFPTEKFEIKDVLRSIGVAAIWIPYFLMSTRSKETFTNVLIAED